MTKKFDLAASQARCLEFRKRILHISQTVSALHIASAYSCMEITELCYFSLMRRNPDGTSPDTFVMSKGHGCLAQYMALEKLGVLESKHLDRYCKPDGILGTHPDYGNPGIEASTGSLGHGMTMSAGIAYAHKIRNEDANVYAVLSDGELQEGSTWEGMMIASSLGITNLVAFLDLNDFQSLGRTSELHPTFYPVGDKVAAFGWEVKEIENGHDSAAMFDAVMSRKGQKPLFVICRTTKGKGVSYMENVPIWHYRSPNAEEYKQALSELEGGLR
ncbi:MAG: transketolase [Bdellovibrionota bacterium]